MIISNISNNLKQDSLHLSTTRAEGEVVWILRGAVIGLVRESKTMVVKNLKLLLWKNWVIKKRQWKSLLVIIRPCPSSKLTSPVHPSPSGRNPGSCATCVGTRQAVHTQRIHHDTRFAAKAIPAYLTTSPQLSSLNRMPHPSGTFCCFPSCGCSRSRRRRRRSCCASASG